MTFRCLVIAFILPSLFIVAACNRSTPPLEPDFSRSRPVTAIFPRPAGPDEAVIVAKAVFQNKPLAQVQCTLAMAGSRPMTLATDQQGQAAFRPSAQGAFTLTIPEQGDILGGSCQGSLRPGEIRTITFQAGGGIGLIPACAQYADSDQDQYVKLLCVYSAGSNNLAVKIRPEVVHLPDIWRAAFTVPDLYSGQGNTLTVTVAKGSSLNVRDLQIIGRARNGQIEIASPLFAICRDWEPYADIRVVVDNGGVPLENVLYIITDSQGNRYEGRTHPSAPLQEQYVRLATPGAFCVDIPRQGCLDANHANGSVSQAEQKTVTFAVGKSEVRMEVLHSGTPLAGAVVTIIDANGRTYADQIVDQAGSATFALNAVGPCRAWLRGNVDRYYEDSFLAAMAVQNSQSRVTFQGRPGSLRLDSPCICYPYVGGEYAVRIDYRKDGDINYYLWLDIAGLPSPEGSGISGSLDQRFLTNHSPAHFTLQVNKCCFWETAPGLQIHGATYNHPLAFELFAEPVTVRKGWNVTVDLAPAPAVMRKYQETPPNFKTTLVYTITATGMPPEFDWGFHFDFPYREQGFMPVYDQAFSTSSGQVPGSGVIIIWGLNRHGWAAPDLYRDGKASLTITFDHRTWNANADVWY